MLECKLEDFDVFRPNLIKYAKNLLKTRSFSSKEGELNELAKDCVQQVYIDFHVWGTNKYIDENHLKNFLNMLLYRQFTNMVDVNRKGAQYILFKDGNDNSFCKNEFEQLDITNHEVPTTDQFDLIQSFKDNLNRIECKVIDLLLEGYNQVEIAKQFDYTQSTVTGIVNKIRSIYTNGKSKKATRSKNCSIKLIKCDLENNELDVFNSAKEASRELGYDVSNICKCCSGKIKTYKGFKWKYKEI